MDTFTLSIIGDSSYNGSDHYSIDLKSNVLIFEYGVNFSQKCYERRAVVAKGSFKKKNDETYGKFHILGGVSEGSFSICYNDTFKMHKKPF